jgi:hypothetical protein
MMEGETPMLRLVVIVLAAFAGGTVVRAQQSDDQQSAPQQSDAQKPAAQQSDVQTADPGDLKGFPSEKERDSYAFGYNFGKMMQDRKAQVHLETMIVGLNDAFSGKPGRLSAQDATVWARHVQNEGYRRQQAELAARWPPRTTRRARRSWKSTRSVRA